jgi:hypothetical protein
MAYVFRLEDAGVKIQAFFNTKVRTAAIKGLQSAAVEMHRDIVSSYIPASGLQRFRGIYAGSWKTKMLPDGAIVFSTAPHAPIIEYGRRAGAPIGRKMIDELAHWVKVHGLAQTATEVRQIAFAIALSIQRRGMWMPNGLRILEKACANIQARINKHVAAEMGKP